jgi:glycosyltransferase involved in cell wall biosynthesis
MHLVLFFSYGVSLKTWAESGLLQREVQLYKELVQRDVEVTFITYGDETDYQFQSELGSIRIAPYYAFSHRPHTRIFRFFHSLLLPWLLKEVCRKATIFKTNQLWGSWNAILSKYIWKYPILLRCGYEAYKNALKENVHPYYFLIFLKLISYISYKNSDHIEVSSRQIAKYICNTYSIKSKKILVQWNYVNTELFFPQNVNKFTNRCLFIGRLSPIKNIFSLLDAIHKTPYGIDIVGTGELEHEIKQYVNEHNIDCMLLGSFQNNQLPKIINQYHVYLLTSYHEGNPKSLIEAMACSLGVLGTNVEGIQEIIQHEETGLLCETNEESIRIGIERLMQEEELRKRLGKSAREKIIQECSLEKYVEKELAIYREITI